MSQSVGLNFSYFFYGTANTVSIYRTCTKLKDQLLTTRYDTVVPRVHFHVALGFVREPLTLHGEHCARAHVKFAKF